LARTQTPAYQMWRDPLAIHDHDEAVADDAAVPGESIAAPGNVHAACRKENPPARHSRAMTPVPLWALALVTQHGTSPASRSDAERVQMV
jgi:hypothetical protein